MNPGLSPTTLPPREASPACSSPHGCMETWKAICKYVVRRACVDGGLRAHGIRTSHRSEVFSSIMCFSFCFSTLPGHLFDICLVWLEGSMLGKVLLNTFALK